MRGVTHLLLKPLRLTAPRDVDARERVPHRVRGEVVGEVRLLKHACEVLLDETLRDGRPVAGDERPRRDGTPALLERELRALDAERLEGADEDARRVHVTASLPLRERREGVEHGGVLPELALDGTPRCRG